MRRFAVPGPAGWTGKTALFVTDVHYSNDFGPDDAAVLADIVRQQKPDIVFMGGDLAQAPRTDLTGFFSAWAPGCPTIFSPGNHDLPSRGTGTILAQARAAGLIVLTNAIERWNGAAVIGFPSALRERQQLALLRTPGFKIVLGHEPDEWDRYIRPELLHLAGHTHGGQIRMFGRAVYLPALGRKYPLGRYIRDGSTLIVSAGIGYTDVPFRIHCPPQIVRLEFA